MAELRHLLPPPPRETLAEWRLENAIRSVVVEVLHKLYVYILLSKYVPISLNDVFIFLFISFRCCNSWDADSRDEFPKTSMELLEPLVDVPFAEKGSCCLHLCLRDCNDLLPLFFEPFCFFFFFLRLSLILVLTLTLMLVLMLILLMVDDDDDDDAWLPVAGFWLLRCECWSLFLCCGYA